MGRAIKTEPKLIDLYNTWRDAQTEAIKAASGMSITPALLIAEKKAYKIFHERLLKCKC